MKLSRHWVWQSPLEWVKSCYPHCGDLRTYPTSRRPALAPQSPSLPTPLRSIPQASICAPPVGLRHATTPPIAMKLVAVEQLQTVIICIKFVVHRSIRFCFIGSRKCPFHIHLTNGRYNSFALPCSRLMPTRSG